ncbi:beta transducin-like protein HET-E2C*40 [Truncatella angustata]|uniref:Beta transducin-like protein HET-E2C*40 n=1 Tax=Truncatella angustata TaxID=152316 RepID=A0A9P8UQF6_9PEZI|nr:beta transducin-like protein HET-E2C*40 [Truncatella angustata]KAH6656334.1 beta transducin-like protein HET-E2C*40 [Truncatella angustata]
MRLLQLRADGELTVTKDLLRDIPPYAILSHTWGADDDEVTFQEVREKKGKKKAGYTKIKLCGQQAKLDGLEYFWVDTCCIDKTNAVELTEAINSMFRWYQKADKCYVYLADVSRDSSTPAEQAQPTWESEFRKSSWHTRGWTLQELVAPVVVEFYTTEWQYIGDKQSLEETLHEVTRVPIRALRGDSLSDFNFDTRISWSLKRVTSKAEDRAYSLLGLLGLSMSLIYGEGEESAFRRLRKEHADQTRLSRDPEMDASISQCLSQLRISDPRDDRSRIEYTKGGLLKDSYRWVLENKDFQRWRSGEDHHLLWIKGDPGKGKTMLLCGITEEMSGASADACLVSYFFCQATDTRLNNATAVLRGLLYMLAIQDHFCAKNLYEEWRVAGRQLFEDVNAWNALTRIFTAMMQSGRLNKTIFVIDALDECTTDRAKLIELIIRESQNGQAKFLVSSRNWPEIEEDLAGTTRKVRISLELNAESISTAVKVYIRHQVNEIQQRKRIDLAQKNELIKYLVSKADDTFLWVALVCERLRDSSVRGRHIMQELQRYPSGLNSLYDRMLQHLNRSTDAEICHKILGTIAVTYRPLSLDELTIFIKSESFDVAELKEVVESCGSFLTIRNDVVYFVHQSAKDFLTGPGVNTIFSSGIKSQHASIFELSIEALSRDLRRDIYGLRHPGVQIGEFNAPKPDPMAPLRYLCTFWVDHLIEGCFHDMTQCIQDPSSLKMAHKFLQDKFLYWLEGLSLITNVPLGARSMAKLLQVIQSRREEQEFQELIYDEIRILQLFGVLIAQHPLQIYGAILVFSPTQSIVRKRFEREAPQRLLLRPQTEEDWTAYLATLEGHTHWVTSVAFSPDGKRVASASHDGTAILWSGESGERQATLRGHTGRVTSVAFSPDGKHVASASHDGTVILWSAEPGERQATLRGHTDGVTSVAFSPDGKRMASASHDGTVILWSAESGERQAMLRGHTDGVTSVAFSPDGKRVASASHDGTVILWSAEPGERQATLRGHTDWVTSVAFSPDGKRVVSASHDGTVILWSAEPGERQAMLRGHTGGVTSVAFSPDGKRVVSASHDGTVILWSAEPGERQATLRGQTLEGHTEWVTSVAFSPDGKRVVSASHDGTVILWSAEPGERQAMLRGHTGEATSVAFSPDGKHVASASHDGTVILWLAEPGERQATLRGHTGGVTSVAFSPDGKRVVSASHDGTVILWSAEPGERQATLRGHTDWVTSVAFSPDGKRVVSASHDGTVILWSAEPGERQATLGGHTDWVTSVAFSPDGKRVASASHDGTIIIWSTELGERQARLNIGVTSKSLKFDIDNGHILTDAGVFSILHFSNTPLARSFQAQRPISDYADSSVQSVDYGISQDKSWITLEGRMILWLPPAYRPTASAISSSTIAMGCDSGMVIIMRFG